MTDHNRALSITLLGEPLGNRLPYMKTVYVKPGDNPNWGDGMFFYEGPPPTVRIFTSPALPDGSIENPFQTIADALKEAGK